VHVLFKHAGLCIWHLPHVHVLHAHYHVSALILEGTIKVDNVLGVAVVHDAELAHYSLAHFVLCLDVYNLGLSALFPPSHPRSCLCTTTHLPRHNHLGGRMLHFADCSSIARAQLPQNNQILGLEVQLELYANFQRVLLIVVARASWYLGIAGRGRRLGRRGAESKPLEVLPLHRLRLERVAHGAGGGRRALSNVVCGVVGERRQVAAQNKGKLPCCIAESESARQRCPSFRVCRPKMGRRWLANHGRTPNRGQRLLDCLFRGLQ
jgi:hypothetical protein